MSKESKEVEEYLEAMYRKKLKKQKITTTALARELSLTPASVSEMLKKLEKKGLVKITPYSNAFLTKKGEKKGKEVLRKHYLIEDFLVEFGLGKKKAHVNACELEHALSKDSEKIIKKILSLKNAKPLCALKPGEKGRIIYVGGKENIVKRILELGLVEGTIIEVVRVSKYGCPVELLVRGSNIAIGKTIAEKIYVRV